MADPFATAKLVSAINQGRLYDRWPSVLKLLEKLAHTCDIGAVRLDVDSKLRLFYWTVMSEILLEYRNDYVGAMDSIRKAVERDRNAVEWRIIFVRLLLTWTSSIVAPRSISSSVSKNKKSSSNSASDGTAKFTPEVVLKETLKEFPPGEQTILLTLFPENCTEDENSQAVLYALSVLPPQSTQQCCYDILSFLREKNIKDLKIKNKLTVVVYLICLESLKAISIDELFDTVFDESVNEYTTYLQIDAVICRSILNELLGEYSLAQDDLSQLVLHVLDDNDSDIDSLKLSLQSSMLYALCRLPLVERAAGMYTESLASFKRCISGDSVLKSRISSSMKAALTFAASFLLLQKAMSSRDEDTAQADVRSAFSLLQSVRAHVGGTASPISNAKPLEHRRQSLVLRIKNAPASPESISSFATPGRIAILLSAISKRCGMSISNHIELLEWGASFEVQLDLELLWSMACAYIEDDDTKRALPILEQAHHARIKLVGKDRGDSSPFLEQEFGSLISWLNFGPHPISCPWLPITRAVDVYLDRLGDAKSALDFLLKHAHELYPKHAENITSLLDITRQPKDVHSDPLFELMTKLENDGRIVDDAHDKSGHSSLNDNVAASSSFLTINTDKVEKAGLLEVLYSGGRALAIASRSIYERRAHCRYYRNAALNVFSILMHHHRVISVGPSYPYPEKIVLEYSVLLAEGGEVSEAIALVKEAVKAYKDYGPLTHLLSLLLAHAGGRPELYAAATELCNESFVSKSFMSTGLTLALLKWDIGQKEEALQIIETLMAAVKENISQASISHFDEDDVNDEATRIIKVEFCLEWERSPQALRLTIELLVTSSKIYHEMSRIEKSCECIDLAIKLLYTVNSKTIHGLNYSNDLDRLELLRRLPQATGMRLAECAGFGADRLVDCEAEVIAECAAQAQSKGNISDAEELYMLAYHEFPFHVPTLLALADIALNKAVKATKVPLLERDEWGFPIPTFNDPFMDIMTRGKVELKDDSSSLTTALRYATLALRMDDESFDTWYTAGKVYEALQLNDQAKVAFYKAMMIEPLDRPRKYECVLLESI